METEKWFRVQKSEKLVHFSYSSSMTKWQSNTNATDVPCKINVSFLYGSFMGFLCCNTLS